MFECVFVLLVPNESIHKELKWIRLFVLVCVNYKNIQFYIKSITFTVDGFLYKKYRSMFRLCESTIIV